MSKHPGGRPTDYDSDTLTKAIDYLECYTEDGSQIPSVVGLCQYIGRGKTTIYRWRDDEDKVEFRDILEQIMEIQEVKLIQGGLSSTFNSTITKMMMTKHGYADKIEQDVTSGGKQLNTWTINPVTTNKDSD